MNNKNKTKYISALVSILLLTMLVVTVKYYYQHFGSNITGKQAYLYIHTGSNYSDVVKTLEKDGVLEDIASFKQLAEKMNYPEHVKAGKYRLKRGMSNHCTGKSRSRGTRGATFGEYSIERRLCRDSFPKNRS